MSFNEMNTIENALRDHLCGRQRNEGGRMNEVREDTAPYDSSFTLHPSSFRWKYIHGENMGVLYSDIHYPKFISLHMIGIPGTRTKKRHGR
jgi:type I restriction enzyme R subunit